MPWSSLPPAIERARPLLGTRVAIRVHGLPEARAHEAIDSAFDEIALIHSRMSFHDAGSDVSRLNREALDRAVVVHRHTFEVLRWSREIAEASHGCFDVTVAAQLVDWGLLPRPDSPYRPDVRGSWRDVELLPGGMVRLGRPAWIDLGGIAKGYAVDCAIERLRACGVSQACVNAGGDLRVLGPAPERIRFGPGAPVARVVPILEVENGSVASSSGRLDRRFIAGRARGPHVHGARRQPVGTRGFACVAAERCVVADALTKVVLAQGTRSTDLLRRYRATAHVHSSWHGWRTFGAQA